jgi:hypothetical protein
MATNGTVSNAPELTTWLDRVQTRVSTLRLDAYIFDELRRIVRKNKALQRPSILYDWLIRQYAAAIAAGVRRELDEDTRSDSLVRLLRRLKGTAGAVSRERYRSLYAKHERSLADKSYDKLVGRGRDVPSDSQFDREIRTLKQKTRKLVEYADKHIAHVDATPASSLARFSDVPVALRSLESAVKRYHHLLKASHLVVGEVFIQDNWRAVLRVPWIPQPVTSLHNNALHPTGAGDIVSAGG